MRYALPLVLLSLACATASPAPAADVALRPRPALDKALRPAVRVTDEPGIVYVKFRDELPVRARQGGLVNIGALEGVRETVERLGGGNWQPVHTLPEQRLVEMRSRAQTSLGRQVMDLRVEFFYHLPDGVDAAEALDALNALAAVEIATPTPKPPPPPVPPDFTNGQGYLEPAPTGVDAPFAWSNIGTRGEDIFVVDIEYDFNGAHQDFPNVTMVGPQPPPGDDNHGTAVLGVVGALDNGFGITGIAPDADLGFSTVIIGGNWNIGGALTNAANAMDPGDVIIIEQHIPGPNSNGQGQFGYVPVEWLVSGYNAVVVAVGNGIVVVEAAGNGQQDLDAPIYSTGNGGHWPFLPQNDSGSILVGGGAAPPAYLGSDVARSRLGYSNYGSRVNVQGWGERVWTTGYGDLYSSEGANLWYTRQFNGTSSASPVVAGACALVQSAFKAQFNGATMPCQELRTVLMTTGSPQQAGQFPVSQNIGPLPDVPSAVNGASDCNANDTPDFVDIDNGTSVDENGNFAPDECDCLPELRGELVITASGGGQTAEDGDTVELECSLVSAQAPTAEVVVVLESLDTSEGVLDTTLLLFTPQNWSSPQVITVTGVDDGAVDGDVMFTVRAAVSSDDLCWTFTGAQATLLNTDNDRAIYENLSLHASDAQPDDQFGLAVAMDGDTMAVGAFGDDDFFNQSGAAYIFRRNGAAWVEQAKLHADAPATGARFGSAVAVDGARLLVGAPRDSAGAFLAGAASVFEFDGAVWSQTATLLSSDIQSTDNLGVAVDVRGDLAVVGADSEDALGANAGAVYVFRFDGAQWMQEAKLIGAETDSGDLLGHSVTLGAGTIVAGAPGRQGGGAAVVFRDQGAGAWAQEATLTAADAAAGFEFGKSVFLDADTLAVGAPGGGVGQSGAVYLFNRDGSSWTQTAALTDTSTPSPNRLGHRVALDGDVIVAGAVNDGESGAGDAAGSATAFLFDGAQWSVQTKMLSTDLQANDQLGGAAALSGGVAAIGAALTDAGGDAAGSAYVFTGMADCDGNGVLDALDIADGAPDADGNGVPDACESAACPADLTGDGSVDGADLASLLGVWGACADPENCPADLTGDDSVDGADLASLLGAWGGCP